MTDKLKDYTVILMRPSSIADPSVNFDTYVAQVRADSTHNAVSDAQDEVRAADIEYGTIDEDFDEEYRMVMVFKGHVEIVAFGW